MRVFNREAAEMSGEVNCIIPILRRPFHFCDSSVVGLAAVFRDATNVLLTTVEIN
jgi:hypothetical protein